MTAFGIAGVRAVRIVRAAAFAVALASGGAAAAAEPAAETSKAAHPFAGHVADAARRFSIPEAWIWAVIRVESGGDARAVSHAGAMGLMQIMPITWSSLRRRLGLGSDPYDVRDNIMAGAAYLREMHDRYGDPLAMLAAYNAGPGRYDDYLARRRPLPPETRDYVATLAPIIGGGTPLRAVGSTPPDPFAWTRAALFTARSSESSGGHSGADQTAFVRPPDQPSTAPADIALAAVEPPSTGLFVPRSGQFPR